MNKVKLVGRLTRDPDVKTTATQKTVAAFTLAVERRFKNKNGEKEADFIPIVVWGKLAEHVGQYLEKGSLTGVSGRLQIRNYEDKNGKKRYITEVIGEEVSFLSTRKKNVNRDAVPLPDEPPMEMDEDFQLIPCDEEFF